MKKQLAACWRPMMINKIMPLLALSSRSMYIYIYCFKVVNKCSLFTLNKICNHLTINTPVLFNAGGMQSCTMTRVFPLRIIFF